MTNMNVSQLISSIAYLKCYLEECLNQNNALRELNEQKDAKMEEMRATIKTLENQVETQNTEITELKELQENALKSSSSEHKAVQTIPSNDELKQCQEEMILILKERCDDLTVQLHATRKSWHEKCMLIEKYRRELIDVGDQVTGVHKKLSDMKIWQKQIESFYTKLKQDQQSSELATSKEHNRINSEITDLKRVQNELMMGDEIKGNAIMGTGDGICNDERKLYHMNQVTFERNEIVNRIEIIANGPTLDQFDSCKPNAVNPISMGMSFLKNLDLFGTVKTKIGNVLLQLAGPDKRIKKESLIKYGLPATIVCCFITGTFLTQMIIKSTTGNRFTIARVGGSGSKGFVISAPLLR